MIFFRKNQKSGCGVKTSSPFLQSPSFLNLNTTCLLIESSFGGRRIRDPRAWFAHPAFVAMLIAVGGLLAVSGSAVSSCHSVDKRVPTSWCQHDCPHLVKAYPQDCEWDSLSSSLAWGDINILHTTDVHGWYSQNRRAGDEDPADLGHLSSLITQVDHVC